MATATVGGGGLRLRRGFTMAPGVREAVTEEFQERSSTSANDAQAWLAGLVGNHRYVEDIWAST